MGFFDFLGGQPGTQPTAQWAQNPQWSWTEGNQQLAGDWAAGALGSINEGNVPWYIRKQSDAMRQQQQQGLHRSFYGGPSAMGPGVLESQASFDVSRGLGRGAGGGANYGKQLQKYAEMSQNIEQEISKYQGAGTQGALGQALGVIGSPSQQGPQGQWMNVPGQPRQPGLLENLGSGFAQMAPWMNQLGNLSKLFGGGQGQPGNVSTTPFDTSYQMPSMGNFGPDYGGGYGVAGSNYGGGYGGFGSSTTPLDTGYAGYNPMATMGKYY